MKRKRLRIALKLLLLPASILAQEVTYTSVILEDTYYCGDHLTRNALDGTATYYFDNGYIQIPPQNQMAQPQYYYYTRDHLGSIREVMKADGDLTSVFHADYDAWGRQTVSRDSIGIYRGYTGHEMLPEFGLINMNGRMYDPLLGRFLSPDNYVQLPDLSQSFNRYSYCLNNPLKYTDPSGELFGIDDWVIGGIKGLFNGEGWFKSANRHLDNCYKIWKNLFETDSNKSFLGRVWELFSRFSFQKYQTGLGLYVAHAYNMIGHVNKVDHKYGSTVLQTRNLKYPAAVTLGNVIIGHREIEADPNDETFQHEYGHYLQSQSLGPFYLPRVGVPSIINAWMGRNHKFMKVEQNANIRAFIYFNKHVDGYYVSPENYGKIKHWDFSINPLRKELIFKGLKYKYVDFMDKELMNQLKKDFSIWIW